jgi:hypothetical protein
LISLSSHFPNSEARSSPVGGCKRKPDTVRQAVKFI